MATERLIKKWFSCWEAGAINSLPISKNFKHTSPFGTIEGQQTYLELVYNNKDKFLNHTFVIHDAIYSKHKACVRYTAIQDDFKLDVSEWYVIKDNLIQEVIAYYHIGNIRKDRLLTP